MGPLDLCFRAPSLIPPHATRQRVILASLVAPGNKLLTESLPLALRYLLTTAQRFSSSENPPPQGAPATGATRQTLYLTAWISLHLSLVYKETPPSVRPSHESAALHWVIHIQ